VKRRLAAIMAADVVGYSRMMEADEAGTLGRMQALLAKPIKPTIEMYRGRIVKTTGDGILAEFPSVVDAVQSAVEIQQALVKSNIKQTADRQIRLRIGINLGDIIVDAEDIHGSGVNIAARLESLADPGAICVTDVVRDQVAGRLPIRFRDLGLQSVKNIAAPIHVYSIDGDAATAIRPTQKIQDDKPSIAVLPFVNMSDSAEQTYFCDGITEDIITELSRFRTLIVISRNSSFQFRGVQQDIRRIGRELSARYVLEGSVRVAGNRVRITGQLVDSMTNAHVWANRYDRQIDDVFATQDAISQEIVSVITRRLEDERLEQARSKPPENMGAYDWCLKGKRAFQGYSHESLLEAKTAFEKAIEADPDYARAIAYLGYTHNMATSFSGWGVSLDEPHELALQLAQKAASLDPTDHMAEHVLGWCQMFRRQFGEARRHFDRAYALNPNDADALVIRGWYLGYTAQHAACEEALEHARRLNPLLPDNWTGSLAALRVLGGRYEEAIAAAAELAHDPWPEFPGWLAIAHAHLGHVEKAQSFGAAFVRNVRQRWRGDPGAGHRDYVKWFFLDNPIQYQVDIDRFIQGFKIAGLDL
jgi:TolB-like protein/class 3 adenylate cyclase